MSDSKQQGRPSQVTMAGWVAAAGSGFTLVTLFDAMSRVRSIEVRDSITEFLSEPPGNGLGISADSAVELLRGLMFLSGAAAAAAMVLAIFVLQRNNAARIGLSVAAVVLVLTAPVSGFLAVLVGFATAMLWTRPARDWFAGRPPAAATDDHKRSDASSRSASASSAHERDNRQEWAPVSDQNQPQDGPHDPPHDRPTPPHDQSTPPPTHGFGNPGKPAYPEQQRPHEEQQPEQQHEQGQQPEQVQQQGQQQAPQYGQPPQGYYIYPSQAGNPDRRPVTVTVAAWLTWVFSGLTALLFSLVILMLLVAKDTFYEAIQGEPQFQQAGVGSDELVGVLWVMSAIVIFWCLASIVLAVLAYRRANWARITLAVSAGMAALFSLLSLFGSPASLVTLLGAGAVVVLLFTGGANGWYSSNRGSDAGYAHYPPQYGPPQYGPPQYGAPQQGPPQQGPSPQDRGQDQSPDQSPDQSSDPPKNVW